MNFDVDHMALGGNYAIILDKQTPSLLPSRVLMGLKFTVILITANLVFELQDTWALHRNGAAEYIMHLL